MGSTLSILKEQWDNRKLILSLSMYNMKSEYATINDIREQKDLRAYANEIYDMAKKDVDVVYLTICSDVLDFAFNPGGPVDGNGLTSYELCTMIYEFGKRGLCGMDYVEVYPMNDPNQNSAHFVSTAVLYVLAGHIHGGHSEK